MPQFQSGVSSYIKGRAIIEVSFPVDQRGNADISCSQCFMFRESSKRCGINYQVCEYPNKYVGSRCPLEMVEETE